MSESGDDAKDFIFRFRIPRPLRRTSPPNLAEVYRAQLFEYAKLVQFHFRGAPVDVDAFAFRNAPGEVIPLLPVPAEPSGRDAAPLLAPAGKFEDVDR